MSCCSYSSQASRAEPFTQRLYDPGVTRFSIQVKDIDAAFARVKDRGIIVDTTGGGPVFTQQPRNNTRAVMMRDPDGFVFEFVQGDSAVRRGEGGDQNIFNARRRWRSRTRRSRWPSTATARLQGARDQHRQRSGAEARRHATAVARSTATEPPGSNNVWFFWEFSQIARTKRAPAVVDPGASALSMLVEDLPALLRRAKRPARRSRPRAATGRARSRKRAVLVRSPDGLLIELIEDSQASSNTGR